MIIYKKIFDTLEEANSHARNLPADCQDTKNLVSVQKFREGHDEKYRVLVKRMEHNDEAKEQVTCGLEPIFEDLTKEPETP
ncbi:hypothetical protein [Proteiniclasticum sp. QWL-01]|uniref:hypothetical protein n=1 Tax=Proteiniclasticum sp. QWL-01 TaxID=3036945 RepID=UPI0022066E0E|nr:hypothetical protein [Proteiniclasticum sp. QWL-01]UUM13190.1 hypothetical protein NQU17_06435 [Clostridiaceae bacterium HFYG-1003]WFF71617.1 hypothetical protein P6M73_09850 [Proteiniclasticum sp. QWL-01]